MTGIPDAAVKAFLDGVEAGSPARAGWFDETSVRAGLAAAWPHLAAQALREAARFARREAFRRGGAIELGYTSGWLERRADELEGGTGQEGHGT